MLVERIISWKILAWKSSLTKMRNKAVPFLWVFYYLSSILFQTKVVKYFLNNERLNVIES